MVRVPCRQIMHTDCGGAYRSQKCCW
ncbi:TPA: hypothetical protein MIY82_30890 [Klebsiella pneumoniae]|nr:hypothetical protein [Klebsiella pneumoniae]